MDSGISRRKLTQMWENINQETTWNYHDLQYIYTTMKWILYSTHTVAIPFIDKSHPTTTVEHMIMFFRQVYNIFTSIYRVSHISHKVLLQKYSPKLPD